MAKAKKIEVKQEETQPIPVKVVDCPHRNQLDKGAGVLVCNDCGNKL